ncbi:alpha/beta fold hydrolase [Luteolibacter sp. AS25]|uniref:alpha/beta fold hydrolase n=1 Tax=Luteolibacter sp. AS25 TaxID=3135776 RepID=UPI00398B867C
MDQPQNNSPTLDPSEADLSSVDSVTIDQIPGRKPGRILKLRDAEIYFERFGAGKPVLLLHGGAATIESWFCQIPALAEKYELIVPDARGHGRSPDVDGPIDFDSMAADFCELLDHVGLKNVAVVGWSDGAVTGMKMAMMRPDLISKVVTLGAHSRPEGMTDDFRAEVEGSTAENFPEILSGGYKALSPDGPDHWPVVFGKLKTMWLTLPDFSEGELQSIQCPVLLVVGESDIVTREESKRMESLIPDASLKILEGASHYAPVEVPEIVNAVVLDFIDI